MKIIDVRLTGLAGGTVAGGWADELKPEDDVHTIVEVLTDEDVIGVGSVFTSKALVAAPARTDRREAPDGTWRSNTGTARPWRRPGRGSRR